MDADLAKELLDQLADFHSVRDELQLLENKAKEEAVPEEVKQKIKAIEDEFLPKWEAISDNIAGLEEQIKELCIKVQGTLRGSLLRAEYVHGKRTWDSSALEAYGLAHPAIMMFRKQGEPTCRIVHNR